MKKIFSALIVLLVAASLFAGGGKDKAANTLTVFLHIQDRTMIITSTVYSLEI